VNFPNEMKYRNLKKSNAKLNEALFSNVTILTLMSIIGFMDTDENYEYSNDDIESMKLIQACQ